MISSKSSNVDAKTEFLEPIRCESRLKYRKDAASESTGVMQELQLHGSQSTIRSIYMNCVIIGNPFLGYRVNVTKAFLNKHKLSLGQSYWFDHGDRTILNDALTTFPNAVDITAGGETLNIALAAQNICTQAKSIVVMGVKSTDEESVTLTKSLREVPLSLRFEEKKTTKTNVVAVFSYKNRWCEVYYFDSSSTFGPSYLDKPIVTKILERANVLFSTDSSIYMMPEAVKKLAYYSSASFKVFCASLYNVSLMSLIKDDLKAILAYTDVLFLNKHSARALIKLFKVSVSKVCLHINKHLPRYIGCWLKTFSKKTCMVIICDSLKEVYLTIDVQTDVAGKFRSHRYKETHIVDMFGAHQGFIGGFLAMLIQGYPVELCLDCGFLCASMIASQFGVRFPENKLQLLDEWLNHFVTKDGLRRKCVSNMAFSFFHTPWKLQDVEECNGGTRISSVTDTN